jgi:hypothetical protein
MSLHVGEVTSTVEMSGVPAAGDRPATAEPPIWDQRERHRRLVELDRDEHCRTAGEGFDG